LVICTISSIEIWGDAGLINELVVAWLRNINHFGERSFEMLLLPLLSITVSAAMPLLFLLTYVNDVY